ncbi:hypothetical protein KI387_008602, partial [Taxus chinensis]
MNLSCGSDAINPKINFKDSWQKDEALKTLGASVFKDTHCHPQDETSVPHGGDRAET